jgi:uncharacterized protein
VRGTAVCYNGQMQTFIEQNKGLVKFILVFLGLFLLAAFFGKLKEIRFIGSGLSATNTITVQGEGKIERAPDTAKVTYTVRNEAKDLKTAQGMVSTKVDAITEALKNLGVEERYIKTESYTSYPQYDYPQRPCIGGICPQSTPVIRGYEVSHSVTVSIKDLEKVNDVLGVLGTNGVSDMNGPNFGFEDDKAIAREARDLAIKDAREQAKALAKSLNVKLVRIVSFSEAGTAPSPLYARDAVANQEMKAGSAPSLPVGDQRVQSNVTVVYEIR